MFQWTMGLFEKDYILRMLEQLTQLIQSVRARLEGGTPGDALALIGEARRTLAGPLARTLDRVDGSTLVSLLGPERARLYAELSRLEARARADLGEDAASRREEARAAEIERSLGACQSTPRQTPS
jgi:hypothetical protein